MIDQQVIDELVGNFLFVLLPLAVACIAANTTNDDSNRQPRIVSSKPITLN